jgi:hypothetical protein
VAVWLPWGLICIFDLATIQNIIGVTSVNASGSTDVRVMYGGVQTAMGLMAARALYDQRHFETFLHALAIMGCTMALSRTIGLILDGSSTFYTWAVLLYEASAGISAIVWLKFISRRSVTQ